MDWRNWNILVTCNTQLEDEGSQRATLLPWAMTYLLAIEVLETRGSSLPEINRKATPQSAFFSHLFTSIQVKDFRRFCRT
ncbi:hypothetical protein VNO77_17058 [Canavalia gladiata]|uniref:Uncharacterized protein n=1 Tax=Canavalia gladiata TaxID=3824 RepID=A0AAN9QJ19_CANGL